MGSVVKIIRNRVLERRGFQDPLEKERNLKLKAIEDEVRDLKALMLEIKESLKKS